MCVLASNEPAGSWNNSSGAWAASASSSSHPNTGRRLAVAGKGLELKSNTRLQESAYRVGLDSNSAAWVFRSSGRRKRGPQNPGLARTAYPGRPRYGIHTECRVRVQLANFTLAANSQRLSP